MSQTKHSSASPTTKLVQAFSDFLIGFSIFLIVAGLIGTVFVIQDLQENTSQDVRSEAKTAEVEVARIAPPVCETIDVCLQGETEDSPESCSSQEICDVPPNCYYQAINCITEPCPYKPLVLICPTKVDDIFFADTTQLDSPTFYLDESGSTQVPESELKAGQTYYFSVEAQLQNQIKNTSSSLAPSFFLGLRSNERHYTADLIQYGMLTNHKDGYAALLKGSFVAQALNTFDYSINTIDVDGTVIIEETNYQNNKHKHTFEARACSNNPDVNNDGKVDLRDYSILSGEFLSRRAIFTADINCDSTVDMRDYSIMASHFTVAQ